MRHKIIQNSREMFHDVNPDEIDEMLRTKVALPYEIYNLQYAFRTSSIISQVSLTCDNNLINRIPLWISPNIITICTVIVAAIMYSILAVCDWEMTAKTEISAWTWVVYCTLLLLAELLGWFLKELFIFARRPRRHLGPGARTGVLHRPAPRPHV